LVSTKYLTFRVPIPAVQTITIVKELFISAIPSSSDFSRFPSIRVSQPSLLSSALKASEGCFLQRSGVLFLRRETHPSPPAQPGPRSILNICCRMLHQNR
ncbi:hypothetical protein ES319_A10G143900v1, partial [Gossypium barbadense]